MLHKSIIIIYLLNIDSKLVINFAVSFGTTMIESNKATCIYDVLPNDDST